MPKKISEYDKKTIVSLKIPDISEIHIICDIKIAPIAKFKK